MWHNIFIQSCWSSLLSGELADKDWNQSSKKWENCPNCNSQSTSFAKSESANGEQQSQSSWTHLLLWFNAWNLKIAVEQSSSSKNWGNWHLLNTPRRELQLSWTVSHFYIVLPYQRDTKCNWTCSEPLSKVVERTTLNYNPKPMQLKPPLN